MAVRKAPVCRVQVMEAGVWRAGREAVKCVFVVVVAPEAGMDEVSGCVLHKQALR